MNKNSFGEQRPSEQNTIKEKKNAIHISSTGTRNESFEQQTACKIKKKLQNNMKST